MIYLKLFEQYENIESICNKYNIYSYTVNKDGSIDVNDDVHLGGVGLSKLPLNFNIINGFFNCPYNKLTTLKGCPIKVEGFFNCSYNKLTTLKGCPIKVEGHFNCSMNKLTNLKGTPTEIENFNCSYNKLTNLEDCPQTVVLDFSNNDIISLEGLPDKIEENFYYENNPIEILLDQIPKTKLTEFSNIYNDYNPIKGNIISKFKMDQIFDELNIKVNYDTLKKYYIVK